MKFSIAPLCLLVSTFLYSSVSAYSHDPNNIVIQNKGNLTTITFLPTPMDDYDFSASSMMVSSFSKNMSATPLKYPVKADDAFIMDVMENVKADLNAKVFSTILGSFCREAAGSIRITASILGGMIQIGEINISAMKTSAMDKLKTSFEGSLQTETQNLIYDVAEKQLRKSVHNKKLTKSKLERVLMDMEKKIKSNVRTQLPLINANLHAQAKDQVNVAVKGVKVNIPLIVKIRIDADFNIKSTLDSSVNTALKVCARIDAKKAAKELIAAL